MISKGKRLRSSIKFFQIILKGDVWISMKRIHMRILGLSTDKNQSSSHLYILSCWRQFNNRNLKQRPRRKQQQRQKTIGFMSKTTSPHVHHAF